LGVIANNQVFTGQPGGQALRSVPVVSQVFHHAQFLFPLALKGQALLALPLVEVLGELNDVCSAEFRAWPEVGRDAQDRKDFCR
jgi:hypothetical protein